MSDADFGGAEALLAESVAGEEFLGDDHVGAVGVWGGLSLHRLHEVRIESGAGRGIDAVDAGLHVIEGEVAVRPSKKDGRKGEVVAAGRAVRIERAAVREGKFLSPGFATVVERAKPRERPDLVRVYEGFFRDPGMYQPAELAGGKGWDGPWRLRQDSERGNSSTDTTTTARAARSVGSELRSRAIEPRRFIIFPSVSPDYSIRGPEQSGPSGTKPEPRGARE